MSGKKIVAGLNQAVGYAQGWNAAIEEAAKVADGHSESFAQGAGEVYIAAAIGKEIRKRAHSLLEEVNPRTADDDL